MKTRAKQKSNLEQTQKKIEVTKSNLANWTLPWWSQNLVNRCITAGKAFKDHLLTTSFLEGRGQFGVKGSLDWERMNHLRLQVWLMQWTTAPTVCFNQTKAIQKFSLSNKSLFLTNILLLFPCSCFQMASIAIIGDYLNCTSLSKIRYGPCRCRCEKDK